MLIKLKETKMNRNELKQFLTDNDISFQSYDNAKLKADFISEIWVESGMWTSMSRKDNAQSRKALRLLCKKYTMMSDSHSQQPIEWNYNDNVGPYNFKGQKVEEIRFHFNENNILDYIIIDFRYRYEDVTGYKLNSIWASKDERESARWGMNTTSFKLMPKYTEESKPSVYASHGDILKGLV